ncbi:MAG TPA: hypothetical protein VHO23_02880, partial [Candidatus Paceibacterota bacterium]|nr:hypothetical protein [Candidatus Paceibacterota bacterium]
MKTREKEAAIGLRQLGESLKTIATKLNVSKSTVSLWVRDIPLSADAADRIARSYSNGQRASQTALRSRTLARLLVAKNEAEALIDGFQPDARVALIMCSLIYWCEGGKRPNDSDLTFSKSDGALIESYLSLLRQAVPLNERKFRVRMHLHEYHDEEAQLKFWSKMTRIPEQQFTKTYWKPHTGKRYRDGYQGCIHIGYHDVTVSRKIHATARAFLRREVKGL